MHCHGISGKLQHEAHCNTSARIRIFKSQDWEKKGRGRSSSILKSGPRRHPMQYNQPYTSSPSRSLTPLSTIYLFTNSRASHTHARNSSLGEEQDQAGCRNFCPTRYLSIFFFPLFSFFTTSCSVLLLISFGLSKLIWLSPFAI